MKSVIQRVSSASVTVDGKIIGEIGTGLLVFLGISETDTKEQADKLIAKISKLRVFADENGKTNLSINDVEGGILVISQFTLYADCLKGNRPSFTAAARPALAKELYEYFIRACQGKFAQIEHGEFGADMKVCLVNDGPFTILLEY